MFEPIVQQDVPAAPPPPSPPIVQHAASDGSPTVQFQHNVDKAMKKGTMTKWTVVELKSICRLHMFSVRGTKAELLTHVTAHFSQLYP